MTKRRQPDTVSITTKVSFRTCRRREPQRKPERDRLARGRSRANIARRLALAHLIERKLESGELRSYAQAARLLGVHEVRVLQIANLTLLAPDIQIAVIEGRVGVTETQLRAASLYPVWDRQRKMLGTALDIASDDSNGNARPRL